MIGCKWGELYPHKYPKKNPPQIMEKICLLFPFRNKRPLKKMIVITMSMISSY
jgi:hypothetical protein